MDGLCVVSEWELFSILSLSMEPHAMSWAEAALALVSLCGDLKHQDLLRPLLLMWDFKKLNLT